MRVDPKTQATQLLVRAPKGFAVPRHWHSGNETHMVVSGSMIMERHDGTRVELAPGSYNYMPARMVHRAWTGSDGEALIFISVDSAWDINWVEGPPKEPGGK